MHSKDRYRLCPPVPDGDAFWVITDLERMFALVSISKHFPNAEHEARRLYRQLTSFQLAGT